MDMAAVRTALHRQPFEPFTMRLADGRSLPVPQRDFVALGSRHVIVVDKHDSWCVVEPILIVSLDYKPKDKRRNGSRKHRRG
jgi:hypothetical protein